MKFIAATFNINLEENLVRILHFLQQMRYFPLDCCNNPNLKAVPETTPTWMELKSTKTIPNL